MVSFTKLYKVTEGFSPNMLIGSGSFSSVYKGILDEEENPVAVKVLSLERRGADKSFVAEYIALRNARHRNLVKILTCCSSRTTMATTSSFSLLNLMPINVSKQQ